MPDKLNVVSFNCRGIRNLKNRTKLFAFLHNHKYDIVFLQETHSIPNDCQSWSNEWGGEVILSHGDQYSKGAAILFKPKLFFHTLKTHIDGNGRFIVVDFFINNQTFTLINVYGPNIDDPAFFSNLTLIFSSFTCTSIIWAGDFNFVNNLSIDKIGGLPRTNFKARSEVFNTMDKYDLIDIWRDRHPHNKRFSWHSDSDKSIHCRLDFFLCSRQLAHSKISSVDITPIFKSDHSCITMSLDVGIQKRGRGYWKLNVSLLSDEIYVDRIRTIISDTISQHPHFNHSLLWEAVKVNIRSFSIAYSGKISKQRNNLENKLLHDIAHYETMFAHSPSDEIMKCLSNARRQLDLIYDYKFQGIVLRSRARWAEKGEKNSRYFLNLEHRNKSNNCISEIITSNGDTLTHTQDILAEARSYYAGLYSKVKTNDILAFFNNLNKNTETLTADQRFFCEGLLSFSDCKTALLSMANNKTPGSDGLPVEFYKTFWNEIGPLVVHSLNFAYHYGCLSDEQGRATISLIPKPPKDLKFLKNWRPIALLNTDYKIGAKCIASRLKAVLNNIISPEQSGFLKGRYIGENIRLVLDTIAHCNSYKINGVLIFLDFEKAFDSLDWDFLFQSLSYFSFGPELMNWIKIYYSNTYACVSNNGHMSSYFQISRGVRQGCPLSPYLFIICSDIFIRLIKFNNDITGIRIFNREFKITHYADDTVLLCNGSSHSINSIMGVIKDFGNVSGLKVNCEKSYLFPLGLFTKSIPQHFARHQFPINCGPIPYLGIVISNNVDDFFRLNYLPKLSRLKNILCLWSTRDLTPLGKITLIKSFAISQLVFLFTVLPNPPRTFIADLNKVLYSFIWNNKPDKIKRLTLINTKGNGGLDMVDVFSFSQSLKCTWVKRYIDDKTSDWKYFFDYYLKPFGMQFLFKCNFSTNTVTTIKNSFCKQVCEAWATFNSYSPTENFGNEIVFNNSYINIGGNCIFYKSLVDNDAIFVRSFFNIDGFALSYETFKTLFDITNFPFTLYYGIINAVPSSWKSNLTCSHIASSSLQNYHLCERNQKISRLVYHRIIGHIATPPTCVHYWNSIDFDKVLTWENIFTLPHIAVRDSTIKYFQIRFLHRILGVNHRLYQINYVDSPLCSFCHLEDETILHLFCDCLFVKRYWSEVFPLCINENYNLSISDICFGFFEKPKHPINFFILYAKYYIFGCRSKNTIPDAHDFYYKFHFNLDVEYFISKENNTLAKRMSFFNYFL